MIARDVGVVRNPPNVSNYYIAAKLLVVGLSDMAFKFRLPFLQRF
jgi:hypothetical protein